MSVVQIKGKNQTKETVEYYANGSYYDIPLTEQNGFLSTFPDAQKTYPYKVGEETYNIPENEVGGFLGRKARGTGEEAGQKEGKDSCFVIHELGAVAVRNQFLPRSSPSAEKSSKRI